MSEKTTLIVKTGLFAQDKILDQSLAELSNTLKIDISRWASNSNSDWDGVIDAMMKAEKIVTI